MANRKRARTPSDERALGRARAMVSQLMKEQLTTADTIGEVPATSMRWFLYEEGNVTVVGLNRMLNALGYELRFGIAKVNDASLSPSPRA